MSDLQLTRPQYRGEMIKSYIDGSDMLFFDPKARQEYTCVSFSSIGCLALVVVGVTASIYVVRDQMDKSDSGTTPSNPNGFTK